MRNLVRWTGMYPATVVAISLGLATMSIYEKRSVAQDVDPSLVAQAQAQEVQTLSAGETSLWDAQQASGRLVVRLP